MKGFFLWLLYNPITLLIKHISSDSAATLADRLGEFEWLIRCKVNPGFVAYIAGVFDRTPLEGRAGELARECFRQRYRTFFSRILLESGKKLHCECSTIDYRKYEGRGLCFPLCHYGYFYIGFDVIADSVPYPLFTISVMGEKQNSLEESCIRKKKDIIRRTKAEPVFTVEQFVNTCLPLVAQGKASYAPTFDAVAKESEMYRILGGKVVLSIKPTARFALKHRIPMIPYFVTGQRFVSVSMKYGKVLDPQESGSLNIEDIERWYLSQLEEEVIAHPEQIDWYFWWKNTQRFENKQIRNG